MGEADLVKIFRKMLEIRTFEEKVKDLFAAGRIPGFLHLSIGQEAVAVGVCDSLRDDDYLLTGHRGHGHVIAKGVPVKSVMAEIYGKKTGCCMGKGGSLHLVYMNLNIVGCSGIVGASIPVSTGTAMAAKMKGSDQVTCVFFGDGATNTGAFHEGVNLASVWKLPVVFVCENNQYAITTHYTRSMMVKDIAERVAAYRIPGVVVDGMDVIKVREAAHEAVSRAREAKGPTLIECKTYRFVGHHQGDPVWGGGYRTREDVEEWMERCPIKQLEINLEKLSILSTSQIASIKHNVQADIEEAVEFAEKSQFPAPEDALSSLYSEVTTQ
jgi:pyruvate dehydrogenase E1 component alpha subunit